MFLVNVLDPGLDPMLCHFFTFCVSSSFCLGSFGPSGPIFVLNILNSVPGHFDHV